MPTLEILEMTTSTKTSRIGTMSSLSKARLNNNRSHTLHSRVRAHRFSLMNK